LLNSNQNQRRLAFEKDDESRILQYRLILQYHLKNMAQFCDEALEDRKNSDRFLRSLTAAAGLRLQACESAAALSWGSTV
jgi:hypothetical protein